MSNTPPSQRRRAVLWALPEFTLCVADPEPPAEIERRELHENIGQVAMEQDFLKGALGKFPGPSGKR